MSRLNSVGIYVLLAIQVDFSFTHRKDELER